MIEELRNFIMEMYAIPGKKIDEVFYIKICSIMSKYMNLSKILSGISFEDYYKSKNGEYIHGVLEAYDTQDRTIHVYKSEINSQGNDIAEKSPREFSDNERKYLKYIVAAQATMHEVVHVQQEYFCRYVESIEGKRLRTQILNKCEVFSLTNIQHLFGQYPDGTEMKEKVGKGIRDFSDFVLKEYGCSIIKEHDAQCQSYRIMDSILSNYGEYFYHLKRYVKSNLEYFNLMGYKVKGDYVESPAYNVMKFMIDNGLTDQNNMEWMDKNPDKTIKKSVSQYPDTFSRFSVGLPITNKEYNDIIDRCQKANREGYIPRTYNTDFYDVDDEEISM